MIFRTSIAVALALLPAPLLAQAMVQPLNQSDADLLAEQVRRLGADPRNMDALLTAAELSVRLDDLSAAGAFLARAEKVMLVGARGAAIRGAILVRSERPGEALRQFAAAEAQGFPPARFAADRGLAFDLIGEQRRAQADYRLALKNSDNDEVRRRLGLSLGISGKNREALDELAPLVRRNDRGAWRARAFVLAMNGNATEALGIAQTMMPPGSAQGLRGFFAELPRLPAVDRAFAVHFGEVRATPQRLADARLAPQFAALPPEPAPVQVAAAAPPAPTRDKGKRKKDKNARAAVAAPAPVLVAAADPLPAPPAYRAPAYVAPAYQPPVRASVPAYRTADRPLTPGEQASLAAATLPSARARNRAAPPSGAVPPVASPVQVVAVAPRPTSIAPANIAAAKPTLPLPVAANAPVSTAPSPGFTAALTPAPLTVAPVVNAPSSSASATTGTPSTIAPTTDITLTTAAGSSPAQPRFSATIPPEASAPVMAAATLATTPAESTPPPVVAATTAAAAPLIRRSPPPVRLAAAAPTRMGRAKADDILAKIVANLSIPASELGVSGPAAGAKPSRASRLAAQKAAAPEPKAAADRDDPKAKKLAARKAAADKEAAAEKKALADKAAAEKKAARAEPARIWVQVAGGANEGDLARAWKSVRAKAPGALAGKQGYTTPLRATNRVLTGPFKTDAEARAYVNQLAKSGVSAFAFTSDPGQKISKLGAK